MVALHSGRRAALRHAIHCYFTRDMSNQTPSSAKQLPAPTTYRIMAAEPLMPAEL